MIKDLLADNMVDFVGLQESLKKKYSNAFFRKIDPNKKYVWHWIPSDGKSRRILCGVNLEKFDVTYFSVGTFSLSVNVMCKKEKKKLLLVSVYGPSHDENKEDFLTEVSQLCARRDCPMIMGGDFNILRYSSKKIKHSLLISTQTSLTR